MTNTGQVDQQTRKEHLPQQAAAVACVLKDTDPRMGDGGITFHDKRLDLYNTKQKETYKDVVINSELNDKQRKEAEQIVEKFKDIFSDVPRMTHIVEHKVKLTHDEPIKFKPYPVPYKMQEVVDKEIADMLAMGIIEPSDAPYASPLVLVKKPDGTFQVCVNFKDLNKITVFDSEPMMSANNIFPKLPGSKFHSTFDFSKGYGTIPMEEKSKKYTTFVSTRGLMRFKVMPFGMVNSGSTYNRMIRKLMNGTENLESYVDDILGHFKEFDYHLKILRDFFNRVKNANLVLNQANVKLDLEKLNFSGITCKVIQLVHRINPLSLKPRNNVVADWVW